jgi:hypothetical protein
MLEYRGGFLVNDGHFNRVFQITLDGAIEIVRQFNNVVPTGMAVKGNDIYISQAGTCATLTSKWKSDEIQP